MRTLALHAVFAGTLCACAARAPEPATSSAALSPLTWPIPEGGKKESLAFPLPFAPELPYRGSVELRFQPEFFDPSASTYFSYAFAWLLDAPPSWTAETVRHDLGVYYAGLAKRSDPDHFRASEQSASASTTASGEIRGVIHTQDGFNGGRPLTLHFVAEPVACGAHGGSILFSVTPHADVPNDAVWPALRASRAAFTCR